MKTSTARITLKNTSEEFQAFHDASVPVHETGSESNGTMSVSNLSGAETDGEDFDNPGDHERARDGKENSIENFIRRLTETNSKLDLEVAGIRDADAKGEHDDENDDNDANLPPLPEEREPTYRIMEGFMKKRSHGVGKFWHKRWFYLINDKLIFFKRGDVKPSGIIPLNKCKPCVDAESKAHPGRFSMGFGSAEEDRFYFDTKRKKAASDYNEEMEKVLWMDAINNNIDLAKDSKQDISNFDDYNNYWNQPKSRNACCNGRKVWGVMSGPKQRPFEELQWIHWRDYSRSARTGDLLLFNTVGKGPAIIRFGTNSVYDHVGLVVKVKGQDCSVLEALGEGVGIAKLSDFKHLKWWQQYRCIVIRRLNAGLTPEQVLAFQRFVKSTVGRKYKIWKPSAMYRKKSTMEVDDPGRSFFCSELVACAYKQASLLPRHQASCRYFPGSFAESSGMLLLKGAKLGTETKIVFDKSQVPKRGQEAASDSNSYCVIA